ncbi:hypothetical protein BWQ96_00370 [Gracilariopsis chorda]|uniref:Uncharacterized protein n=1 Tax=Gracilariopsis chorda TaxID=448386 RepID=A0A2V3J5L0_9FLOR|nr:hypothetical protein BWQ96_00370 [Gracilariopsis chorda]|eukprot:PXF49718.1 hypothetical protein BWQ96_00370 [Gracilariopsis chorda]
MKTIISLFFALAATAFAIQTVDMCPNRCNTNRAMSQRECSVAVTRGVCSVDSCSPPAYNQTGFICRMPRNSFIIPNTNLPLLEFVVEYSWSSSQSDLDTSTRFLDANVGYSCSPDKNYVAFSGDDVSYGGKESITIDVLEAFEEYQLSGSTSVATFAGWHGNEDEGDATLKVFLRKKSDLALIPGAVLSSTINPGTQYGCAATAVGTVQIVRAQHHTRFTLVEA